MPTAELDTIVNLCKRRGFIFQSSEIYGGLGSCWDYGPLGVLLKNNIKRLWWRDMIDRREDMVGLDASILMHPTVWKASGHVDHFADPLVDCKACRKRFRADQMAELGWFHKCASKAENRIDVPGGQACKFCGQARPANLCPACGEAALTEPRMFNLMFRTAIGPVQEAGAEVYLRPETAQGIFVNFDNVLTAMRKKLPFGIGQVGKSFRNEITPQKMIFRTLEFEQMEIEYFVKPGDDERAHEEWKQVRMDWYARYGIRAENLKLRAHGKDELAHYAKGCYDVEYNFPWGWSELEGIANRTDFDLKQHSQFSGKALTYFDDETKQHIVPYVIEPSAGADRSALAFLVDAYHEEKVKEEKRTVLRFHPEVAPFKVAVFPLLKNRPEVVAQAKAIATECRKSFTTWYDDTAAIGKLYRRQDEVGTPLCVTVDVQSLEDKKVTVRDRDTMGQDRVAIPDLVAVLREKLKLG
jgi:glycyl-tRNA synthetase